MAEALALNEPEALRHEIDLVREDLVESIHRLRDALSPRRAIQAHPGAAALVVAASSLLLVLAIRTKLRHRRAQDASLRLYLLKRWR